MIGNGVVKLINILRELAGYSEVDIQPEIDHIVQIKIEDSGIIVTVDLNTKKVYIDTEIQPNIKIDDRLIQQLDYIIFYLQDNLDLLYDMCYNN